MGRLAAAVALWLALTAAWAVALVAVALVAELSRVRRLAFAFVWRTAALAVVLDAARRDGLVESAAAAEAAKRWMVR